MLNCRHRSSMMLLNRQSPLIGRRASLHQTSRSVLQRRTLLSARCQSQSSDTSTSEHGSSDNNRISTQSSVKAQIVGAGACVSSFFALPGLLSSGGSGGNRPGGGGGGDGGGSGGFGQGPLYDLAADEKDEEVADEEDESTEEEEPEATKVTMAGDAAWKDLLTPSDQIEDIPGQRAGTNRCVEIAIEGWPDVGSLPKLVGETVPETCDDEVPPILMRGCFSCMGAERPQGHAQRARGSHL